MSTWTAGWEVIRRLGEGGQGTVDLVVTAARRDSRKASLEAIVTNISRITPRAIVVDKTTLGQLPNLGQHLAEAIQQVNRPNLPSELGALKQLHLRGPEDENTQALKRFSVELRALSELRDDPAILRLIDHNLNEGWMVTEYHERRTLADNAELFKGNALAALRALEPLIAAVRRIHDQHVIHRDIKPGNVFIADDGHLVLGDFGIVFWADERQTRLTDTYGERVGSRDWMAPWANRGKALADINPTFDIFPLGKLLWSMLSGQAELPYWWWKRPEYNLEVLFPDDPGMPWVNSRILANTVVENEGECVTSAQELLDRVRSIITLLEHGGQRVTGPERWCRVCGHGHYKDIFNAEQRVMAAPPAATATQLNNVYANRPSLLTIRAQVCDACGHIDLFHFSDGKAPPAWKA